MWEQYLMLLVLFTIMCKYSTVHFSWMFFMNSIQSFSHSFSLYRFASLQGGRVLITFTTMRNSGLVYSTKCSILCLGVIHDPWSTRVSNTPWISSGVYISPNPVTSNSLNFKYATSTLINLWYLIFFFLFLLSKFPINSKFVYGFFEFNLVFW